MRIEWYKHPACANYNIARADYNIARADYNIARRLEIPLRDVGHHVSAR